MKRICVCILFTIHSIIFANMDIPENNRYLINDWEVADGLPSDSINDIVQTPDGYLWIGSEKGLVRYDGIKFDIIKLNTGTQKSEIYVLFIDRGGILWIGSSIGLTSIKSNQPKSYSSKEGFLAKKINCINEDIEGNLWIGTSQNFLYCFKENRFHLYDIKKGIAADSISSIYEDNHGDLWICAFRDGLYKKEKDNFKKIEIGANLKDNFSIYCIFEKKNNQFLLGTSKGLFELNGDKVKKFHTTADGLLSNDVIEILEDSNGDLWIGTLNGVGVLKQGLSGKNYFRNYLNYNSITSLYDDRERNIWIGTNNSGMKCFRKGDFHTLYVTQGSSDNILSIYEDKNGYKWIGTPYGLFQNKDGKFEEFSIEESVLHNAKKPNWIRTISEDKIGNLWFGSASSGLFKINRKNDIENLTIKNGLASNTVLKIYCNTKNNIWIGTDNGLSLYHDGVFETYTTRDGLISNQIQHVFEDRENNLWISGDSGINFLEKGKFDSENNRTYLPGISVAVVFEDRREINGKSIFWIGTFGAGLKRLNQGRIISYTKKDGLPSNYIYQIIEDKKNNFWLSSNIGIIMVEKEALDRFALQKSNHIECYLFGISDGMKNVKCSKFGNNSAIKTKEGDFWFATAKGISSVNPAALKINKLPPPVIIEEFLINGKKRGMTGKVFKVSHCMGFRFTAPSFISPEKIKFKYKLEGFDKNWTLTKPHISRFAHYEKPPPGKYCFRVTACNSNGVWNKNGSSFTFTIEPYYYQSIFFWLLVSILFIFTFVGSYFSIKKYLNYRKNQQKYKHSTLDDEKANKYLEKLLYLMEIEKIFKHENISLKNLANKLLIPPSHLSQIINEKLNKTFFDLINSYRIEEAKKQMLDSSNKGKSILEIAYKVGFFSQAAFYRAFKRYTGVSPTEFKKNFKKK